MPAYNAEDADDDDDVCCCCAEATRRVPVRPVPPLPAWPLSRQNAEGMTATAAKARSTDTLMYWWGPSRKRGENCRTK